MDATLNRKHTVIEILTNKEYELLVYKSLSARVKEQHNSAERFMALVKTECRINPKLTSCSPQSFLSAITTVAQLGLELGKQIGDIYLVPYGAECNVLIGYKGLIKLAYLSGDIKIIKSRTVLDGDHFSYKETHNGSHYEFEPDMSIDRTNEDNFKFVFASMVLTNGENDFAFMTKKEVDEIKKTSKSQHIWKSFYGEMAKKSAIKRLLKTRPISPELQCAIQAEEKRDFEEDSASDKMANKLKEQTEFKEIN